MQRPCGTLRTARRAHAAAGSGRPPYAKPVGFVSYGGVSGGLRAVEQLRLVFAELRAVTVRDTVSFDGAWSHWWAWALREARASHPYAV
jgi:NAD(P)H-dependent FMN reductase